MIVAPVSDYAQPTNCANKSMWHYGLGISK